MMVQYCTNISQLPRPLMWQMTPLLAPPIKPHRAYPHFRGGTLANKGSVAASLHNFQHNNFQQPSVWLKVVKIHKGATPRAYFCSIGTKYQNFQATVL